MRTAMRRTVIVLGSVFLTVILQLPSFPARAGRQGRPAGSPEEVARRFYAWYLHAGLPNPKRSNMATFRKYATRSFLKRATARDVDSDLFIDAQDSDESWADNFNVSKAEIRGGRATVQVALNGKEMKYKLRVTLRREGGVWKIDDVKGSAPNSAARLSSADLSPCQRSSQLPSTTR